MPLLRALAHLVLVLAFVAGGLAQPSIAGIRTLAAPQHHVRQDAAIGEPAHDHGMLAKPHPAQERDACQTACCVSPSQIPPRVSDIAIGAFFCTVRYPEAARSGAGRALAPDPEVPKLIA